MVTLDTFQGHIVLYCKGHYEYDDFFEGLKMIWAIRCGYDYKQCSSDVLTYIANDMYKIISICMPNKLLYLHEVLHKEVANQTFYKPKNMSPIEAIIWEYRGFISNMQIKDKVNKNYKTLVKLPNRQIRIFNRILKGNGNYDDYQLIKEKDAA